MAPTLVTSCTALPPEGVIFLGAARRKIAPTLVTSCTALPPEGVIFLGAARRKIAPMLVTSCTALDMPARYAQALRTVQTRAGGFGAAALNPKGATAPAAWPIGMLGTGRGQFRGPCLKGEGASSLHSIALPPFPLALRCRRSPAEGFLHIQAV
jgi:hypothetical protein